MSLCISVGLYGVLIEYIKQISLSQIKYRRPEKRRKNREEETSCIVQVKKIRGFLIPRLKKNNLVTESYLGRLVPAGEVVAFLSVGVDKDKGDVSSY